MGTVLIGLGCSSLAALEIPFLQPPLCSVPPTSLLHHRMVEPQDILGRKGTQRPSGSNSLPWAWLPTSRRASSPSLPPFLFIFFYISFNHTLPLF